MSVYTTQLRYICEQYAGRVDSGNYKETAGIIESARPKIFDFDYPIYDQTYKRPLETKIINHFYFREIGAETAAQFKFMLHRTLTEIMPYYNNLYYTADLKFNPFHDVDYFRDHKGSDAEERQRQSADNSTSNTAETGQTSDTSEFSGQTTTTTEGSRTTTIDNNTVKTLDLTDERTLDTEDQTTLNTQDQTTHNTTDTTTHNTTDTKTLNTTDTKTYNTTDTTRKSDTPQGGLTGIESNNYLSEAIIDDKTGTETLGRSGTETGAKTGTESTARTGTETTNSTGTTTTAHTGTDTLEKTGTDTTTVDETQSATETSESSQTSSSTTENAGTTSKNSNTVNAGSSSGSESISGTDQYIDHIYGKMGGTSYASLIQEYRETLINIDLMIINELEVCFMNIY